MDSTTGFKPIQDSVTSSLVATTKSASRVAAEDLNFHRTSNPSIGNRLDQQNARLLGLAQRLLGNSATNSGIVRPRLRDAEDVDNNWSGVVDVIDSLLERADTALDEFSGVLKRISPSRDQPSTPRAKLGGPNAWKTQDIPKPQLLFEAATVNDASGPFKPFLSQKPHAVVPLEETLKVAVADDGTPYYPHPYQPEIGQYRYPHFVYEKAEPILYQPMESTTATFVDTLEALDLMIAELKSAKEIAIDLEHHDQRSYIGIVSLMQISTRTKDWVVDTLKPWRRKLERLNEVFTDPSILKVLHGSHMDNVWLQRDFGVYIVGLFDTYHAAVALSYPSKGLAFLLQKHVNFQAQKQYQTADWRIRPLPAELFDYARSDTHFLLYIYDCMRNELIRTSGFNNSATDKIRYVLDHSKEYNLQRYENPIYDQDTGFGNGWYKLLARSAEMFSKAQFAVFRAVHQWRDQLARNLDDSPSFLMNNTSLFNIAHSIPKDLTSLLASIHPISSPVRSHQSELLALIMEAEENSADGPEMMDLIKPSKSRPKIQGIQLPVLASTSASAFPAPTVKAISSQLPLLSSGETNALRANTSSFWGLTFNPQSVDQRRTLATDSIRLAVPLPRLTAEIFENPDDLNHANGHAASTTPFDRGARAEIPYRKAKDRTPRDDRAEVFTIKSLGGKRKRDPGDAGSGPDPPTASNSLPSNGDDGDGAPTVEAEISLEGEQGKPRRLSKKERKQMKKQAKAERAVQDAQEAVQPFDYANAPSVLHAKRDEKPKKGEKKGFDPYKKAMDAPKGLGKVQKGSAGKSGTFKG
ncbi:MAG: exosome nuclease subunit [Bogoriella megaspora]|nr:MAG: exosome nuclease subunit [Bogoriella megaspora]